MKTLPRPAWSLPRRIFVRRRRGSVYLLVLGLAMVLTLIGVAAVTAGRIGRRSMTDSQDWVESQSLAFSAAEHAMAQISRTAAWRTTFNGQTVSKSLGRGTFTWRLADEDDGSLTDDPAEPFVIVASGSVGRAAYALRVHMTSPANTIVSGVSVGVAVTLSSNATIDSFDSSRGAYGGANVGSDASVRTNSTAADTVTLTSNARINGSVLVGPGGDPGQVIETRNNSRITGATGAMDQAMTLPTITAPTGLGPNTGNLSYAANQIATVSSNLHVANLSLSSNSKVRISGNVTIWAEGNVSIASNANIEVLAGSSLSVYVNGSLTISSNAASTVANGHLASLRFYNLGANPVTLSSNATVEGVIISPNATVQLSSNAEVFGAVIARNLTLSSNAEFHEDKNITNQVDRVVVGGTSAPKPDAWGRIVQ